MITVTNLCKDYRSENHRGYRRVLSDISFTVARGERLAVLGRNGAGKSTLIRLLSGVEMATSGVIDRKMTVSWPVALGGAIGGSMTGNDNVRFLSRIYAKPFKEIWEFVDDFAELGKFMSEPVRTYSSGMQARLNFACSLAFNFDCYLVDEVLSVGDQRFQRRSYEALFEQDPNRTLIIASHFPAMMRGYCTRTLVLHHGRGMIFDDLDQATSIYENL